MPWTNICRKCLTTLVPDIQSPNYSKCPKCGTRYYPEWDRTEKHAGVM